MQMQVQSYLSRARIAAQRESVLARTEAQPALERLVRVMRKLNPEKQVHLSINPPALVLAMELQDVEETVGNLLENAARHARGEVWLNVRPAPSELHAKEPGRQWIVLDIDDDGPGLNPDQIALAMKRGKRLDESKPGTGLGLSIVSEIVREYQGTITLSRRDEGATCPAPVAGRGLERSEEGCEVS